MTARKSHDKKKTNLRKTISKNKNRDTPAPEVIPRAHADVTECGSPDSTKSGKVVAAQSPSSESLIKIKLNKRNSASSRTESINTNRKLSISSGSEELKIDTLDSARQNTAREKIYYVKLGAITERSVFVSKSGFKCLMYCPKLVQNTIHRFLK